MLYAALQVGVGSGIKCGVNVWRAVRPIRDVHQAWEHRLTEQEKTSIISTNRIRTVSRSQGMLHIALRLMFMLLMCVIMMALHWYMMNRGGAKASLQAADGADASCAAQLDDVDQHTSFYSCAV